MLEHTIAVVDFAHGGTTMLAGILQLLGVPMVGKHYRIEKCEDLEVIQAMHDEGKFQQVVECRNRQHPVWGFKMPGAWHYAELLKNNLRSPIFLAIFKDPVSVTRRRFGKVSRLRLISTLNQMQKAADGMRNNNLDVQLLSYLDACNNRELFVDNLIKIAQLEPTHEQRRQAVEFIQPNQTARPIKYPEVLGYA